MSKKGEYVNFKNFESIPVPEDNGKQNPNESYTNEYLKHVACSKYCSDVMKKHFKKQLVMTKEDNEDFYYVRSMIMIILTLMLK